MSDNRPLKDRVSNGDGTYNGVKLLSILTGLSEDEVRKSWEEVKRKKEQEAQKGQGRKND